MFATAPVDVRAQAQPDPARDYPARPVRFIAPFVPGAGTDITTRTIAKKLAEVWGHQVVVDNRTGAAGAIGVDITAKATPDGYTICLISASHTVNAATNPKLPYDLAQIVDDMLQKDPLLRCQSANEAAHILARFATGGRAAPPPGSAGLTPGYGAWHATAWSEPPKQTGAAPVPAKPAREQAPANKTPREQPPAIDPAPRVAAPATARDSAVDDAWNRRGGRRDR